MPSASILFSTAVNFESDLSLNNIMTGKINKTRKSSLNASHTINAAERKTNTLLIQLSSSRKTRFNNWPPSKG